MKFIKCIKITCLKTLRSVFAKASPDKYLILLSLSAIALKERRLEANGFREIPFVVSANEVSVSNHLRSIIFRSVILSFSLLSSTTHALFNYDRAIILGQKGNWQQSSNLLKNSIIQNPDRADIVYDLGVSTYKNAEHDKALAYFNQAAHISHDRPLKEQALFNAGNAHVQLKQLHEAITKYDEVLSLNPEHVKAKHNKEVVKKMLEQQSADDKSKADKQKQNQQKDEKDTEQNKNNQQDEQKKQDNKDSDQQQDKQNNKKDQDKQDQNPKNQDQKKQEQQSQQDKKQEQQKESDGQREKQPQSSGQEQSSLRDKASADKQQSGAPENPQAGNEQKLTPALARILQEHEKKDADLNKKMIKAMAGTQKGSTHGNNCW